MHQEMINMDKNITWKYDTQINDEVIKKTEEILAVVFPEDYKMFVKNHDGGYPDPNLYDFPGRKEAVFSDLLSLDRNSENSIVEVYFSHRYWLPAEIIPFACDPFGNYICFDYRSDKLNPCIVFYNHKLEDYNPHNLNFICASFTQLLEMLYGYE